MKVGGRSIKTRDWAMVKIIQGVTKAGVHSDKKKDLHRSACRGKMVELEEDGDSGGEEE